MSSHAMLDSSSSPARSEQASPQLTIGMPLYNNAQTVRRALDSLVRQSFQDIRILISDDGSTDGTPGICEEYASRDPRIEVVRQPRNLNYGNFRYVLGRATTPYFMFAAGDDYWHADYAARMIGVLESNPAAVCAVSRVEFVLAERTVEEAQGTQPLIEEPESNILRHLAAGDDNSRMYGVFRTPVAQRAFPPGDFFAYDWAFSAGTLREGTHVEVPEVLMWRERTDPTRYIEYVRRDARGVLDRVFPMLPLTTDLVRRLRIPFSYRMARELFWLNVNAHLLYLKRYHPLAARISEQVLHGLARTGRILPRGSK